jgi:hypothetical protein
MGFAAVATESALYGFCQIEVGTAVQARNDGARQVGDGCRRCLGFLCGLDGLISALLAATLPKPNAEQNGQKNNKNLNHESGVVKRGPRALSGGDEHDLKDKTGANVSHEKQTR